MKRVTTAAATTALILGGLAAATPHASASGATAGLGREGGGRDAGYALKAAGYGSRVSGGRVPTGSKDTAFTAIGCGTKVGIERENHEADARLPGGAGTASAVRTDLWTTRKDGGVHSYSRNRTANVVLAQSGFGKLRISAITSLSHAWHDGGGFHAETRADVGELEFVPPGGGHPQELDLPTPGHPVVAPGLAKVTVGQSKKHVTDAGATAEANALRVTLLPTATRVTIGHSAAQALDGIKHGTFHGYSAGSRVSAADDSITSGRTPLSLMPCQGTDGKLRTKAIADVDLGDQVVVQGLRTQQSAEQLPGKSRAMERGAVAGIDIGNGRLTVDGIVGQANVTRTSDGKVTSDTRGTTLGTITVDGQPQSFPKTGDLEIQGLAKLERHVVERTKYGISVVSLRITLLDGTGAVIDLGVAEAKIR